MKTRPTIVAAADEYVCFYFWLVSVTFLIWVVLSFHTKLSVAAG